MSVSMSPFTRDELKPKVTRKANHVNHYIIKKSPIKNEPAEDEILTATLETRSRSFFDRPSTGVGSTHAHKPKKIDERAYQRNKSAYNILYHNHAPEPFIRTGVK